jgi:hypothetical protein
VDLFQFSLFQIIFRKHSNIHPINLKTVEPVSVLQDIILAYVNSNTCAQDKEKSFFLDVSA